jgi:hypothetical protein
LESSVLALAPPHRRRWLAAVLSTAVVLPVLGFSYVARAADDAPVPGDSVVGELVQAQLEDAPHEQSAGEAGDGLLTWIETADGDSVRLSTDDVSDLVEDLTGDPDGEVPVGATVEVVVGDEVADEAGVPEDLEPAREVLAAEMLEAAPEPEVAAAGTVTNEVTVVMVVPANGAVESGRTMQQVLDAIDGPVRAFWSAQTNGAVQIATAAVNYDWAPSTYDCSSPGGLWSDAAARANWTAGPGKHLLVYLPRNSAGCAYGLAEIGGSVTTGGRLYVTDVATSVIAHELGHNFGLGHSFETQCDQGIEIGTCREVEYRDYYDVMGISGPWVGELNAPHAARMGVLPAGQRVAVTAPTADTVRTLSPYGSRTGTRAIKLTTPGGVDYWLEYRTATGQDAWLGTSTNVYGLQQGVLLRRDRPAGRQSLLLDATPSASTAWGSDWNAALPVGVPVSVGGGTFTVTVESANASGATVRVSTLAGDTACGVRSAIPNGGVALLTSGSDISALVVGADRALWQRPVDGTSTSWRSLSGTVLYGPAAADDGATSYAFVVGLDATLYVRTLSHDPGSTWTPWTSLGGSLTGSPAAAALGAGSVRVFGRGLDNQLWSRELVGGTWRSWTSHGGYLTSPPTATADLGNSRIQVVVRGSDGLFYEQSLAAGSGPAPYTKRDLMACSALAMSSVRGSGDPAGGAFVDSRGAPRLLETTGSRSLGGQVTLTPAVEFPSGGVVLVGRGTDNGLWLYDGRSGTPTWRSLGGTVL